MSEAIAAPEPTKVRRLWELFERRDSARRDISRATAEAQRLHEQIEALVAAPATFGVSREQRERFVRLGRAPSDPVVRVVLVEGDTTARDRVSLSRVEIGLDD